MKRFATTLMLSIYLTVAQPAFSQQSKSDSADAAGTQKTEAREQRLAAYLSGIKLVGKFTIDGQDAPPKTEEYTISKCEKLEQPDLYRMTARIKYGEIDAEVPLELKILWSGNTPVITMDRFWIPAMGTFDARVMIHNGRYAGTWQHDAVGGHMFGILKKTNETSAQEVAPQGIKPQQISPQQISPQQVAPLQVAPLDIKPQALEKPDQQPDAK